MRYEALKKNIRRVSRSDFDEIAWQVYNYQYEQNILYRKFIDTLLSGSGAQKVQDIPSLPISFFKTHEVKSGRWKPEVVYKSSATTGSVRSQHFVRDNQFYKELALMNFEKQYGPINEYCIIGLLPGYLERGDSSLISMMDFFIQASGNSYSGFYLDEIEEMKQVIGKAIDEKNKIILLGVSYALWQIIQEEWELQPVIIMETGGMKGKGPELPKAAFHEILKKGFQVPEIHSEYGMTELMSQAYSSGRQRFYPANTMQVFITDVTDPMTRVGYGKSGVINVIDLANLDTCSFIATEDLGIVYEDGSFEVLGRVDAAEIRGCNLLISDL